MWKVLTTTLLVSALPATAEDFDFRRASKWHAVCVAARQTPDPFPIQNDTIKLTWDRRAAVAEIEWPNGVRKFLRQLNSTADNTAHFWYGPDTSAKVPDGQMMPIDCCYNAMLSFRARGEYALTIHDIAYGGMKAMSQEGYCTFTPADDLELP